jgi:hypothetical protein
MPDTGVIALAAVGALGLFLLNQKSGGDGSTLGDQGSSGGGGGAGAVEPDVPGPTTDPRQLGGDSPGPAKTPFLDTGAGQLAGFAAITAGATVLGGYLGGRRFGGLEPEAPSRVAEESPAADGVARPRVAEPEPVIRSKFGANAEPMDVPFKAGASNSALELVGVKPRAIPVAESVNPYYGAEVAPSRVLAVRTTEAPASIGVKGLVGGGLLEAATVLAQVPMAAQQSRALQATGFSNPAASGLATAGIFGGFGATPANVQYAQQHPIAAVPVLAAKGATNIVVGTAQAVAHPINAVVGIGNNLSNLVKPGSGTFKWTGFHL